MAKKTNVELPKGFTEIDKFNGKFTQIGDPFEVSKVVRLNSIEHGIVDGKIYRYPLAPQHLYFLTLNGKCLNDVNGFAWIKANAETENN